MLELVVFICGAVVMVLEMTGSRVLAPYMGTSTVVWTSLIGIILGSMSLGYWWGGVKADKSRSCRGLSIIIVLAGIFIAVAALTKAFVLRFLQDSIAGIYLASAVATLILFSPPGILLGMVSPYAVRLKIVSVEKSGNTVGRLYAISTIGSILGTFLGGFWLISLLGSTQILYVLSGALFLLALVVYPGDRLMKAACLAALILLMIGASSYQKYLGSLGYYDVDTNYNRIVIYEGRGASGKMRIMTTHPRAMQSAMYVESPDELVLPYTRFFNFASCLKPEIRSFLVLGGGGYSFPRYALSKYPEAAVDVVEIDPGVTELAERFFFLKPNPRLNIFHQDARAFLAGTQKKYDLILLDAFTSHYSIPFHLTTVETARLIKERLTDDGVVMVNVLSAIEGRKGRFLRAEYATYESVFGKISVFPVRKPEDGSVWQNVMLIGFKSGKVPDFSKIECEFGEFAGHRWERPIRSEFPPLTDEFAPVESLVF